MEKNMPYRKNYEMIFISILDLIYILLLCSLVIIYIDCSNEENETKSGGNSEWDIDKNGIPKFVETNYIELTKIYRISKFRSSIGHDYSDAFEHCRSMKHYFEPKSDIDWSSVKIFSPITGKITRLEQEWAGTKIEIASDDYPAFRFSIFHVNLLISRNVNDAVTAGEQIGTHIGTQTMSDIAVIVNDPTHQGKMISYFNVITDTLFKEYFKRGVNTREEMIISKEERDQNPLTCSGDTFVSADSLENWVILK